MHLFYDRKQTSRGKRANTRASFDWTRYRLTVHTHHTNKITFFIDFDSRENLRLHPNYESSSFCAHICLRVNFKGIHSKTKRESFHFHEHKILLKTAFSRRKNTRGTKRKQKIHVTVKKVYTYIGMMYAVRTWGQSKVEFSIESK